VAGSMSLLGAHADEVAQRTFNSLYYAVAEVDAATLSGRWIVAAASSQLHLTDCVVTYITPLSSSPYLNTFTVRTYARHNGVVDIAEGYATKMGPDAGQLLINMQLMGQPCPFSIVKTSESESISGGGAYMILSQVRKYPTLVLIRQPARFDAVYKDPVDLFLKTQRYMQKDSQNDAYSIDYLNTTLCDQEFYMNLS